jgi:hypothetical protein
MNKHQRTLSLDLFQILIDTRNKCLSHYGINNLNSRQKKKEKITNYMQKKMTQDDSVEL